MIFFINQISPSRKEVRLKLVNETILNMRRYLIDKKISELKDNSNDDKDKVLEEVMSYYSLKKLLSAKLNRVV